MGSFDKALPTAIENFESTTVPVSHDTVLATLQGDAKDEMLHLPRGYGLEWWRRTSQRHSLITPGHCRIRREQILNPEIDG